MKEIKVNMWDDLHFADGEQRIEADKTVRLQVGDRVTELDLTEVHAKELGELLDPYFAAGTEPGAELRKTARPALSATIAEIPHVNGLPTGDRAERMRYNTAMRRYADVRGIDYRPNPDGAPYYSVTLKARFAAYLRNGGRD